VLVMAGVIIHLHPRSANRPLEHPIVAVKGCAGGSKAGLLSDPKVQQILSERYHLVVKYDTMGSRDMPARCAAGYDFAWPGSEADVDRFQKVLGPDLNYETLFNSTLVLYSWSDVTDALQRKGMVEQKDGVYYATDPQALIRYALEGHDWDQVGLPQLYGRFVIIPTDPTKSESGLLFAAYTAGMVLDGWVPDDASIGMALPTVHKYFDSLGYLEQSTGNLFTRFLQAGKGDKPLIVAYESQGLELIQQVPQREEVLKKIRIIYLLPSVWVSHPLIALTPRGKALLEALKDKDIQKMAWQRHGFRSGVAGIFDSPQVFLPAKVPNTIESFMALPRSSVMDRIADDLSH
jgi:hypothetical protein